MLQLLIQIHLKQT